MGVMMDEVVMMKGTKIILKYSGNRSRETTFVFIWSIKSTLIWESMEPWKVVGRFFAL